MSDTQVHRSNVAVRAVEAAIFNVRWILPLFYVGLTVILAIYFYVFAQDVWGLILNFNHITMAEIEVTALDMIDVVMVANLMEMCETGSYNSFVSKGHGYANKNISSGTLKIKIATSVVIVAMMHLLKNFVIIDKLGWEFIVKEIIVFAAFLTGALTLGVLDFIHVKTEVMEHGLKNQH